MKAVEEAARQQAIQDSIAAAVPDSAAATTTQSAQ
jgi:hypothetical protein